MKRGYTLLEMLIAVLLIAILSALALPQYFNAVENARMTELKILWGRGKNYLVGKEFSADEAEKLNQQLQKTQLNYFTVQLVCRPGNTPCWEVVFTRTSGAAQYQIVSINNLRQLACVPTNALGKTFCKSRMQPNGQTLVEGQEAFLIH